MERVACGLHVLYHTIDNDEWLGVGIERAETTNEHSRTVARAARACDGVHVGTEIVLYVSLYGLRDSSPDGRLGTGCHIGGVLVHALELVGNEHYPHLTVANSYLLAEVLWGMNIESSGECRHLDGELTLLVCHGGIVTVVERLYLNTCQWSLGNGVNNRTLYILGGVGGPFGLGFLLDNSSLRSIVVSDIVLCEGSCADTKGKDNA